MFGVDAPGAFFAWPAPATGHQQSRGREASAPGRAPRPIVPNPQTGNPCGAAFARQQLTLSVNFWAD